MFVNIMSYDSRPLEQCRFESHQKYVDLQYTIRGTEGIEYADINGLETDGLYCSDSDLQFYRPPKITSTLAIEGNTFVIFFPNDAHRPQIALGKPAPLKKLVVKIDATILDYEIYER